ncbi:MAG: sulfotransferase [Actinomycetota bacterium]|nr:sulfotransferase [Actinomycetota bacterium]
MPAADLVTGPPDFVGVGAQRSGTTWWFDSLLAHPAVRPARSGRKELHFFDAFGARPMPDGAIREYHELFPRAAGQIAGEWTPRYMVDVWTPRLLKRAAPEARILVMLRDPVERFRSGVLHRLRRAPEGRRQMIAVDAIERGRYAWQVRTILDLFGPERVLVLQYEACRRDPSAEYRRTLRFLGVDDAPEHVPDFSRPRGSTTEPDKSELWPELVRALEATLTPDVEALLGVVPDLDVRLWPNFTQLAAPAGSGPR